MSREAFTQAVPIFVSTVARIPADAWDKPGVGEWTVRDLTGHASRAISTIESYTATRSTKPITGYNPGSSTSAAAHAALHKAVAERGREAGRALGEDPASAVRELAARVLAKLPTIDDDFPVETPFGVLSLRDYLPTRVVELVVHTLDLGRATGIAVEIPDALLNETIASLGRNAVRQGNGIALIEALTGRMPLSGGFSVV